MTYMYRKEVCKLCGRDIVASSVATGAFMDETKIRRDCLSCTTMRLEKMENALAELLAPVKPSEQK